MNTLYDLIKQEMNDMGITVEDMLQMYESQIKISKNDPIKAYRNIKIIATDPEIDEHKRAVAMFIYPYLGRMTYYGVTRYRDFRKYKFIIKAIQHDTKEYGYYTDDFWICLHHWVEFHGINRPCERLEEMLS